MADLSTFNALVGDCATAMRKFDNFDPRSPEDHPKLQRLVQDWNVAQIALIDYVLDHGRDLMMEIDRAS